MKMSKAQQARLIVFRSTYGDEIYIIPHVGTYNITTALFLIEEDDRDPESVSVEELAIGCGFNHLPIQEEDGFLTFLCPDGGTIVIDHRHVQKELDLSLPLIRNRDGDLIDGHHRLYRAFMLGVNTLFCHQLTAEETELCLSRHEPMRGED